MTEKKPTLEFIGTLGDVRPRMDAQQIDACAASASGIDPCSSAGLD